MAERIQRKRSRGWRMPEGSVYVGRPSKWGNPYRVGGWKPCGCRSAGECDHNMFVCDTPDEAVSAYRDWVGCWSERSRREMVEALRAKNLVCWCPLDRPCHANVLLRLANA